MARPKKEAAVKQTSLPASISDRKLLESLLDEAVGYLQDIEVAKQRLKGCSEVATDSEGKLNLETKYFNALVKAKFDLAKTEAKAEELQSSVDDVRVLSGGDCNE